MDEEICPKDKLSSGVDLNRNYDFHFGGNPED